MVGTPEFDGDDERTVQRIWHIQPGPASPPGLIWAGADPGGLFRSEDDGQTWQPVAGINNHPKREQWQPGAGGLMVHTIIQDPLNVERMFVANSAAGVFRSEDGGRSLRWHRYRTNLL